MRGGRRRQVDADSLIDYVGIPAFDADRLARLSRARLSTAETSRCEGLAAHVPRGWRGRVWVVSLALRVLRGTSRACRELWRLGGREVVVAGASSW